MTDEKKKELEATVRALVAKEDIDINSRKDLYSKFEPTYYGYTYLEKTHKNENEVRNKFVGTHKECSQAIVEAIEKDNILYRESLTEISVVGCILVSIFKEMVAKDEGFNVDSVAWKVIYETAWSEMHSEGLDSVRFYISDFATDVRAIIKEAIEGIDNEKSEK